MTLIRQDTHVADVEPPPIAVEAVKLTTGGPTPLPSDWPMQLGIGLMIVAAVVVLSWWVWTRAEAARAADWLLRSRFCRSVAQWRAVGRIADAAQTTPAAVLISRSAFDRGARAIIESKSPVITPVVIDRLRERVFSERA